MIQALLEFLDRRRRTCQIGLLALSLGALFSLFHLQILDSPERWTPQGTMEAYRVFDQHFISGDNVGVGVHFVRDVVDEDLSRMRRLRQAIIKVEGISAVYDVSIVADEIEHVPLTELIAPENEDRFRIYAGKLWERQNPDKVGRVLLTVCELDYQPDAESTAALNDRRRHVVTSLKSIVEAERSAEDWGGNVSFHLAGGVVIMHELEFRATQVALRFLPASVALGLATLLWGFRSWSAMFTAMLGSMVAVLLVLGSLSAFGGTLGIVTVAAPTMISIVCVASTVHFAAHAAQHGPSTTPGARQHLIRDVCVPCLGAAATTGFGFLMLRFNQLAPIRDLGTQLFAGSLLAFFSVFILTTFLPIRSTKQAAWFTHNRLRTFGQAVLRFPRGVVLASALLSGLCIYLAWPRPISAPIGLYVDADPFSFFTKDQPIAKALRLLAERDFGVYQLDVVLLLKPNARVDNSNELTAAALSEAEEFRSLLKNHRELGVLEEISTLAFRERVSEFTGQIQKVIKEKGFVAAISEVNKLRAASQAFSDTFRTWSVDKKNEGALRLTFLVRDQGSVGFSPLVHFAREHAPTEHFESYLCGNIAQAVHLGEELGTGMVNGVGWSLMLMWGLSMILFRSLKLSLIAILPNILPNIAVYGLMGALKIPISSGSAMVATIALGIAFNDTIHFLLCYRRLTREQGASTRQAVIHGTVELGRPIVLTSVVHVVGFLIFLLTDFQPLFHFGILSSVAMVAALAGDLILLPCLLVWFDSHPGKTKAASVPESSSGLHSHENGESLEQHTLNPANTGATTGQ